MKAIVIAVSLLFCTATFASTPSDESLRELLEITESRKMLEGAMGQMDAMMQASMQQAMKGRTLTPEAQEAADRMRSRIVALMQEEMSWSILEPMFIDIYRSTLTQSEVDGMLAFYKSEAGRAVIAKMPVVMQHTMQAMQQRMMSVMPKMQKIRDEMLADLRAQKAE